MSCRHQQTSIAILYRGQQLVVELELAVVDKPRLEMRYNLRVIERHGNLQDAFGFPTQHRQQPMRGNLAHRLLMIHVQFVLARLLLLATLDLRADAAACKRLLGHPISCLQIFGPLLGDDIERTLQGSIAVGNLLPRVDEIPECLLFRVFEGLLSQQQIRKRLESSLASDSGAGPPLGLERQVDCLQRPHVRTVFDLPTKFVSESTLLVDRFQHGDFASGQRDCLFQGIFDGSQSDFIESLGRFLAIPGDERDGVASVQKLDSGTHFAERQREFRGDRVDGCFEIAWVLRRGCHDSLRKIASLRVRRDAEQRVR